MASHINKIGDQDTRNAIRESLNPDFITKQGVNEEQIEKIVDLHVGLQGVFEDMETKEIKTEFDHAYVQDCANVVREYEFELQEAWGFEKDVNQHTWWFRVPKCSCPEMDNWDYVGTELNVFTTDCIVHGAIDVNKYK